METTESTVHKYGDRTPGAWDRFIAAMHSGQQFECDEEMWYYWLEVLPPVHMGRNVILPDGQQLRAAFGFAEGAEPVTVFWKFAGRYFGCRTKTMNPYA